MFSVFKFEDDILFFEDAFEAMNYICTHQKEISGVFTDYQMRNYGMSGEIIVRKCQELKLPVYICSGYEFGDLLSDVPVIRKTDIEGLLASLEGIMNGEIA